MQKYVIALYIRLSIEDYKYDSMSIENQRLVLNEYAAAMPEALNSEVLEFVDNGYSGTNFERPQVQKLIEMVRENRIDCIIVKDFSRFGRNSIETGYFLERVFPLFHTRFISVSDDYDSDNYKGDTGGMDVAFKYLISEYYSRDMSIKTKSAKYAKMQRGEYQSTICPYGYRKSADGRMEPDPEAGAVVQLIFQLAAEGRMPPASHGICTSVVSLPPPNIKRQGETTPMIFPVPTASGAVQPLCGFWQTNGIPEPTSSGNGQSLRSVETTADLRTGRSGTSFLTITRQS